MDFNFVGDGSMNYKINTLAEKVVLIVENLCAQQ